MRPAGVVEKQRRAVIWLEPPFPVVVAAAEVGVEALTPLLVPRLALCLPRHYNCRLFHCLRPVMMELPADDLRVAWPFFFFPQVYIAWLAMMPNDPSPQNYCSFAMQIHWLRLCHP